MDLLLLRKARSLTLLLLCLHVCVGLSWCIALQQHQQKIADPIVEGISDNEVKSLSKDVEVSAGSFSQILALNRGESTEGKGSESKTFDVVESHVNKQEEPNVSDDDKKFLEHGHEKQIKGKEIVFLHLEKFPVRSERRPFNFKYDIMESVKGSDADAYNMKDGFTSIEGPIRTFQNEQFTEGGGRVDLPGRDERKPVSRPFLSEMIAALSKPWHHCRILSGKEGMFSRFKHLVTAAHNHVKNWFFSNQKKTPTVWSGTEPLAIIKPVAPMVAYPQCTLKEKLLFVLQQVMSEYRSSGTGHTSCAGTIEAATVKLREALSSRLKINLCTANVSPCEKEFCDFLQNSPKLTSLMVFSKFGINPVEVAISHSIDTGVCTSSTEMSHLSDSIHQVMKLGHRIREGLSSMDLHKKEQPTGINFWKSLFAGNQTSCQACLHQVVDNVKKVMKRQLAINCHEAKCPKLVSTCAFVKEHKHLVRILLMLKLQPWHSAARTCAAERACSSLLTVASNWGRAHERDRRQVHHIDRVHMIDKDAHRPEFPSFPAFPRHACRKAMLFRRNPVGLFPFGLRINRQLAYKPVEFFFLEPVQKENHGPERISTDFDAMLSLLQKFQIDIPHEMPELHKHALNILDSFHGIAHDQGVEGKLILSAISEDASKRIHEGLKHPLREEVQVQATGSESSQIENEELHPKIQSVSANEAPSRAEM